MKKSTILLVLISLAAILFSTTMIIHTDSGNHEFQIDEINSISFEADSEPFVNMVYVEGGTFEMGDQFGDGNTDEVPLHNVTLSSFYMSSTEITQGMYEEMIGENPAQTYGVGDDYPVYYVNWFWATEFCNFLSVSEGLTPCYSNTGSARICDWNANGYRLPTEAEWEYAAKGGVHWEDNYKYSGTTNDLTDYAWFDGNNTPFGCKEVGTKMPNQLGIYDMSGNVWEWCWDYYHPNYYGASPDANPHGPDNIEDYRIRRGGDWNHVAYRSRASHRAGTYPHDDGADIGFRIARNAN
jgi:formylglycine-generating enzyme